MVEKIDFGLAGYIVGIVSIVAAVLSPIAGFILGIVGLRISNKEKTELSKRGRKLSMVGMIVSIVMFILILLVTYIVQKYSGQLNFPVI